jgi:hypothetical protein
MTLPFFSLQSFNEKEQRTKNKERESQVKGQDSMTGKPEADRVHKADH